MKKHPMVKGVVTGIAGVILAALATWLTIVYTGAYDVAASDRQADVVRWTLDTTMRRSVARRAGDVEIPEDPGADLLAEGANHYAHSCVHCHGAPGRDPAEWSRGMHPEPPHLVEAATEWSPQEIHWIIANGIKMTGMPAFGEHHDPDDIVALAALVTALPGLSTDDYERLSQSARSK